MAGRNTRMQQWLLYRVRVTIKDGRKFVGTFIAFDRHMNLVLADTEEFRQTIGKNKEKVQLKRTLGFILVRGENIVAFTAEAPPAAAPAPFGMAGPGRAAPAGRGAPIIPPASMGGVQIPSNATALQAPIKGLVGAAPAAMAPQQQSNFSTMPPRPN